MRCPSRGEAGRRESPIEKKNEYTYHDAVRPRDLFSRPVVVKNSLSRTGAIFNQKEVTA
jgi:hypothetical protein